MLIWIVVAVIPIALLGSILGTSEGRSPRQRGGADETWWAPPAGHSARPNRAPKAEEALDG